MYFYKIAVFLALLVATTTTINAAPITQLRRRQEEKENAPQLVAKLELADDVVIEYFYNGEAITVFGTSGLKDKDEAERAEATVQAMGPVKAFEKLSGEPAPKTLTEAEADMNRQAAVMMARSTTTNKDDNPPPLETGGFLMADDEKEEEEEDEEGGGRRLSTFNNCDWWYYNTGNAYWEAYTNKIGGRIEPYRGCLGLTVEFWNGSYWYSTGYSGYDCAYGYAWAWAASPYYSYKRVRTYNAHNDGYHFKGCWN